MKRRRFSSASATRRQGAPDPFIGRTLGDCTIVACLARARRCAVYQARHRILNRDVAVKILSPDLSPDPHTVARFAHEAEVAGIAHHEGLIEVHGSGESNGLHYIIMSLVEGEELSSVLFREGPLREAMAVPLMRQVAVALATLHRARVLHCDIRPANILVTSDEQAVLIGMGQARRFDEPPLHRRGDDPADLPLYFPPEAGHGWQFDPRSDLYLFGATFHHLLCGSPPFEAASPEELALLYLRNEPPPLQREAPGTSPALCGLVQRLLKKDPAERPQNIGQLLDELAPIETEAIGQAKAVARFRKTNKARVMRRLTRAAFLAGAVAALVLIGVLASVLISSPHAGTDQPDPLLEVQPQPPPDPRRVDPEPEPDQQPPSLKVAPVRPPWPSALAMAGGKVARLVDEHRYGEALAVYDALDDRYSELELRERTARMRAEVLRLAQVAYAEVEARADEFEDDGSFAEAQAALRQAADRYGLPDVSRKAAERIAALDRHARTARERREQEQRAAAKRAEQERRGRLRAAFEQAVGRAQRSLRVLDVADAQRRLAAFDPEDPIIGADVARWRRDIDAVAALKKKILDHVNKASPRLHSSTIGLAGAGGTLVRADDRGIAMRLSRGGEETRLWEELGNSPILKLAWRARDPSASTELLACAMLASIVGARDEARDAYLRAEALGADTAARLSPIAEADLAEIADQIRRGEFARAAASLKQFETAYRGSRWLAAHEKQLNAARAAIARGASDAEAEKVYGEATALFEQGRLFELKALVARLKKEYPASTAVRDATRTVPFSRMAAAVKTLGVRIVVSQRFGDVRTLREAVQRAEPYSLIEVAGGIPHIESVTVPSRLRGLVIRGTGAVPPVLTAVGALERADDLLIVEAANVTLERIVLAHGDPLRPLRRGAALVAKAGPLRLRDVVAAIALPSGVVQGRDGASLRAERDVALDAEACAFVGATLTAGPTKAVGCLWVHGPSLASGGSFEGTNCLFLDGTRFDARATLLRCTALGDVHLLGAPSALRDCVLYGVRADSIDTQIDYCHVYGRTGVAGKAKPGLNLSTGKVRFLLPHKLDFRVPRSDRNPASDGGARGYRPNKTMDALRQRLLKLRSADRVHFALTHQRP